jgi:hypothetical protein
MHRVIGIYNILWFPIPLSICLRFALFGGNDIVTDDGRPLRPKSIAVLLIKRWETKSCAGLAGTDWRHAQAWGCEYVLYLPSTLCSFG